MDFCELDRKNFLILVDAYSKWLCVELMTTTTSSKTISVLIMRSWFATYGLPVELVDLTRFPLRRYGGELTRN